MLNLILLSLFLLSCNSVKDRREATISSCKLGVVLAISKYPVEVNIINDKVSDIAEAECETILNAIYK